MFVEAADLAGPIDQVHLEDPMSTHARLAAAINTGVVWVNTYNLHDPAMPFGGAKMSGWGNERSIHALDEYLNVKAVWINTDV